MMKARGAGVFLLLEGEEERGYICGWRAVCWGGEKGVGKGLGGGSTRHACRHRQYHRPPAGRTGISPGWPLAVISLHCPASPQVRGGGICHQALRGENTNLS